MRQRKNHEPLQVLRRGIALAALVLAGHSAAAVNVVVQLRNGDRITGELLAQETNRIVLVTSWAGQLALPISAIGGLHAANGADLLPPPSAIAVGPNLPSAAPPRPTPAAKPAPRRWRNNLQIGANLAFGARDAEALFARFKTTYEKPYAQNPKKFFRTTGDYSGDYGETENVRSANRMTGSIKTDFDLGERNYCYNVGSGGYDEIRKIDLHYEIGPGLGYHLIKQPAWELNVEGGVNYQVQLRSTGGNLDSAYLRLGEDTTFKFGPRLSLTEKFEFFVNAEEFSQLRVRLDATLSYKLIENLSLNLNLIDLFDTDPAPTVNKNEFQIRSSIGITF